MKERKKALSGKLGAKPPLPPPTTIATPSAHRTPSERNVKQLTIAEKLCTNICEESGVTSQGRKNNEKAEERDRRSAQPPAEPRGCGRGAGAEGARPEPGARRGRQDRGAGAAPAPRARHDNPSELAPISAALHRVFPRRALYPGAV